MNNKFLIISLIFLCSCKNNELDYVEKEDYRILTTYFNNVLSNKYKSHSDTIYLALHRNNVDAYNVFIDFLERKKDSFIDIPSEIWLKDKSTGKLVRKKIIKGDSIYNF